MHIYTWMRMKSVCLCKFTSRFNQSRIELFQLINILLKQYISDISSSFKIYYYMGENKIYQSWWIGYRLEMDQEDISDEYIV